MWIRFSEPEPHLWLTSISLRTRFFLVRNTNAGARTLVLFLFFFFFLYPYLVGMFMNQGKKILQLQQKHVKNNTFNINYGDDDNNTKNNMVMVIIIILIIKN